MGIDVLDGRPFETADHVSALGNVVVSRSAASLLWPGQRAVGRRLQQQGSKDWHTVVGVVEDVMQYDFRDTPQALVYYPLVGPTPTAWALSSPAYVIKTARAEDDRARGPRADPRGRARGADVPRLHDGGGWPRARWSSSPSRCSRSASCRRSRSSSARWASTACCRAWSPSARGRSASAWPSAPPPPRCDGWWWRRARAWSRLGVAIGLLAALAATRALGGLLFGVAAVDGPTFAAMAALMLVIGAARSLRARAPRLARRPLRIAAQRLGLRGMGATRGAPSRRGRAPRPRRASGRGPGSGT